VKANAYKPHLLLIPEDPALHDIAVGFAGRFHNVQVDPPVMGKIKLRDQFLEQELRKLGQFPLRFLVLVQDFDGEALSGLERSIPADLRHRVFVLGPIDESEDLRSELREARVLTSNTLDEIGKRLADDCLAGEDGLWRSGQLVHLQDQLRVLRETVLPFLVAAI